MQKATCQMFYWVLNAPLHPFFKNFAYTLQGGSFARKKNGRIEELIFANVWWNFIEQLVAFTKNAYNHFK